MQIHHANIMRRAPVARDGAARPRKAPARP
jgi:hypothetical protein